MASPKVSWQQRRYLRRWNMRPLPHGEILTNKKNPQQEASFMMFA